MYNNSTGILFENIGGLEYIQKHAAVYLPYLVLNIIGVLVGITGNILIMGAIVITKELHNPTYILVFNLALADILISGFVDSTTIVGVFVGKRLFDQMEHLCDFVGVVCLVSCATSMVNIGFLGINRYINICHSKHYNKIFTTKKTYIYCLMTWFIGLLIDLPNMIGWGEHIYDIDTLSCVWNRRKSHSYTLFLILISIVTPSCCVGFCYARIFVFVRKAKRKVMIFDTRKNKTANDRAKAIKFAKATFGSFMIFTICWLPYGLVVMTDWYHVYPAASVVFTMLIAHLNSAFNPILYSIYNSSFRKGYTDFIYMIFRMKIKRIHPIIANSKINQPTYTHEINMVN